MQLSDYIGQQIVLRIPFIDQKKLQQVKLLGVEAGGIWIESQTLMNMMLTSVGAATSPKSLAYFFPYHEVGFGFVSVNSPGLNETALGL